MTAIDPQTTVGALVAERPSRSRVFERFGLDYCCGGKRPLAEACRVEGVDLDQVLAELTAPAAAPDERDWRQATMAELADHIVERHHGYLRRELPRLTPLIDKVATVHGGAYPWTIELREVFAGLCWELSSHMMKEEQILFPLCKQLEAADGPTEFHCGSVNNPIRVMENEHDSAAAALARMRELTGDYTPPADACNTFRAVIDALAELETDMHEHIHKENNILFPRAAEVEATLAARV